MPQPCQAAAMRHVGVFEDRHGFEQGLQACVSRRGAALLHREQCG
jgi:hypothetical protein